MAIRPAADGGLLIAAIGVENHPLVREDGGFGYIDSYLYLYKLGGAQPTKLVELNISELGVVMPKWIALRETAGAIAVTTAGYATPKLLTVTYHHDDFAAPEIASVEISPGTADAVLDDAGGMIVANSLLDAWVVRRGSTSTTVRVATTEPSARTIRTVESRIGELLFFTSMMAPWNSSKDQLSRFTCETCHHEGYGDGRVHFTGRGDVHATTRPLLGLFNNRPYFSRALDESMTQMVHSEFKVANRHNGRDPWFELTRDDLPWLGQVEGLPDKLTPELLRRSLIAFLADFTHRENPQANDHAKLTPIEAKGATVFRDRCASCHAPRLIAEEAKTAVPFEGWEKLVLSSTGGIVWNNAEYAKTGVLPYVHDKGTRIPSLRRLYKKWPYFTNGSAKSLDEVLDRFASGPSASYHDGSPSSAMKLSADDRPALLAFLALL